ncbi:membrane-spanning 4-domains subfamily A member 4A-like [Pseudorasbora parva]|uniref:membrane-spanning 4-domains subfamily A member 4A-like n=1 Tax=Pseudorasbora parva TaxID=51549 RepID=UPI00351EF8E5
MLQMGEGGIHSGAKQRSLFQELWAQYNRDCFERIKDQPKNMTSEAEVEVSDVASGTASGSGDAGTLLEVTFQKNPRQKYKYLEAEPKILGVTEIALTFFFIGCRYLIYVGKTDSELQTTTNSLMLAFSVVGIIAGSVAIAAQNLHLPTLKACLGMQVVTCAAYVICLLLTIKDSSFFDPCWHYQHYNDTVNENACQLLEDGLGKIIGLDQLMAVTQIALSATLAAYCCKVIPCCTATSQLPVIVMRAPTAPQ